MKNGYVLLLIGLVVLLVGSVVACGPSPPASVSSPATESETEAEVEPEAESPPPAIPLNVRIDYVGVKNAEGQDDLLPDDSDGEVQLFVVVTDGITNTPEDEVSIPSDGKGYKMSNFETKQIDRGVFHTPSVGGYLRVSIVAWDIDSKTETLDLLSALQALGAPGAGELTTIVELLPREDDRIGDYQHTWYPEEKWGIGQHEVSDGNFLVGFSIWSDEQLPLIPKPPLLPDVKINVNVPPQISKRPESEWVFFTTYPVSATLINNEAINVEVDWEASCVIGMFYYGGLSDGSLSGKALVPASGSKILEAQYYSKATGVDQITWKISYRGKEFESSSGSVNVIP